MHANATGGGDSQDQVMTGWKTWEGNTEYLYTKWMKPNGITYLTKEKTGKTKGSTTTVVNNGSSGGVKKPKNVPAKPAAVSNPGSFNMAAPTDPGTFRWTKPEPIKKEVLIPQPPISPGPEPTFNFEKQQPVTKYEYLMGIKDLTIKHKQYNDKAVFVSKPMEVDGNVMQVSLHSIEEHPVFDELSGKAADRQTSIEYYIAYSENPTADEWHPILPEDQLTIQGELLIFDTAQTATIRFPALVTSKEEPKLYKNGLLVDKTLWSFADGGLKVQLLTKYDSAAIYTINYTPNSKFYNPWTLDIRKKGIVTKKQIDKFPNGTNHNKTITLSQYPYVDYERINLADSYDPNTSDYKPIQVYLKNAQIAGTNRAIFKEANPYDGTITPFTKNITDYKHGIAKKLIPYSIDSKNGTPYFGFEYMQEGSKLYFTETFNKTDIYTNTETNHGNAEVQVEYEYMVSNFRIKIILRKNSSDTNTLTPIVHEYALKFKVMK